jgi:hypothetical protein
VAPRTAVLNAPASVNEEHRGILRVVNIDPLVSELWLWIAEVGFQVAEKQLWLRGVAMMAVSSAQGASLTRRKGVGVSLHTD